MKKILLLSAVLLGAVSASQAGVRFNLGFGIPLPPPPVVVAQPAPVYVQPPAPVCVNPPVCVTSPVYVPAPVVVAPPVVGFGYDHFHGPYFRHDFHGRDHYRR